MNIVQYYLGLQIDKEESWRRASIKYVRVYLSQKRSNKWNSEKEKAAVSVQIKEIDVMVCLALFSWTEIYMCIKEYRT